MTSTARCPKCGLVQMARPKCKQCGTPLPATAAPAIRSRASTDSKPEPVTSPRISTRTIVLAVAVVAVIAVAWFGFRWNQERIREAERRESLRRELQVATPALQALRAMQSVTRAGLTYGDYRPRLLDAKVQVDRYVQTPEGLREVKMAMRQSMALYLLAGNAWSWKIRQDALEGELAGDSALPLCPEVAQAAIKAGGGYDSEYAIQNRVDILWGCASRKIDDAAALLPTV